jgi:hypothetical protein
LVKWKKERKRKEWRWPRGSLREAASYGTRCNKEGGGMRCRGQRSEAMAGYLALGDIEH